MTAPATHVVQPGDSLWKLSKRFGVSFQEIKQENPALRDRVPPYGINPGDVVKLPQPLLKGRVEQTSQPCGQCVCHDLARPLLMATAVDGAIAHRVTVPTAADGDLRLGQDATFGAVAAPTETRAAEAMAADERAQRDAMYRLLDVFAGGDTEGMARRLFDAFLSKKASVEVYSDAALDRAVASHPNFLSFSERALNGPGMEGYSAARMRIHQALRDVGWDINQVSTVTGLGVPAFNLGNKALQSGDFSTGLGVMMNGVQYVFVYVTAYHYDSCAKQYSITLRYVLYDVFGLDDDDVAEYGGWFFDATRGITAWGRLQHEFGYAPLLTRAEASRSFTVAAGGP